MMRARDNPFSADRVLAVRYRPQGTTWDALMARLAALGWRAAIVGPKGSGKTTLLEDLAPRLRERGFETHWIGVEPVEGRRCRQVPWEGPFRLRPDMEQFGFGGPAEAKQETAVRRRAGPDREAPKVAGGSPLPRGGRPAPGPCDVLLVDGADALPWLGWLRVKRLARRAGGLIVTTHRPGRLPTLVECATSPALLREIVDALGDARDAAWRDAIPDLFRKHRGNLREALRDLYDRCAARPS
jgi:hypothetical protein